MMTKRILMMFADVGLMAFFAIVWNYGMTQLQHVQLSDNSFTLFSYQSILWIVGITAIACLIKTIISIVMVILGIRPFIYERSHLTSKETTDN